MTLFKDLAPRLLAGFGTAALVTAVGLFASSRPAHTAGGPVPVTVANSSLVVTDADAARQSINGTVVLSGTTFSAPSGTLYTVPANKRLVIETLYAVGGRNDANSYSLEVDTTKNGALFQTFLNLLPTGASYPAVTQPLRLYVEPGTSVTAFAQGNGHNAVFVGLSFTGHLVDL